MLGLWASPPFLQTLGPWFPNEIQNFLSSEKRTLDHWQQSSSSSLSPGKTSLTTTVAKFLDTSVCGALDALTPASVHSSWSSPKFLNQFCLTILIRLRLSRLVVHLFPSTQLSVNMLGYSTLWTASFFGNECLWLILLVKGVNDCLLDNCQISSLPHDCVSEWTKLRDHFEVSRNLCRCFELISWMACHHIIIYWDDVNWWVFVKCEPKSSQLKEPKT